MLLDLSSDRWLDALVADYGKTGLLSRRRLAHAWRHLLAADRLPTQSLEKQATELIRARANEPAIDLIPGKVVRLWPIAARPWCQAVALAIDQGLAYGGPAALYRIEREPKLARFTRRLAAACKPAECFVSGQFLSDSAFSWSPLNAKRPGQARPSKGIETMVAS